MITEEQRKERRKGIGGSDIPVILGLSSYKTPYQLYLEKCGFVEDKEEENQFMYWGNRLESLIIEEFEKRNNFQIYNTNTLIHKDYNFLFGNIDGWIPENSSILEVKTCSQFSSDQWGESGSDIIPLPYLSQVAYYRLLSQYSFREGIGLQKLYGLFSDISYIAVLIGGNDYREYIYKKDEILENHILESAIKFWECVQNKTPPEAINQIDLKLMFPKHSPHKIVTVPNELSEMINNISSIKSTIKEYSNIEEKTKFDIMKFMGDAECLKNEKGDILATWKTNKKGSRVFLWKEI